jgi:signal transduction histidine kinase
LGLCRYDERVEKLSTFGTASIRQRITVEAFLVFVVSLIVMFNGGQGVTHHGVNPPPLILIGLVGATSAPLAIRRLSGMATFWITVVATTVMAIVVYPIGLPLGPAMALYRFATTRRPEANPAVRHMIGMVFGFAVYVGAATIQVKRFAWSELVHGGLLLLLCWFAGERTRLQREHINELRRHAMRERNLAAAEERIRIARDLHDSAGHAINVIAVRAGAARLRHHEDPDRSLAALTTIEDLARSTVGDLDQIVGALRTEADAEESAVPRSLASLNTLMALHAEAGLEVMFNPARSPAEVPATIDQAAYRIVQEALTNASRHGTGTANVELNFNDNGLSIRVTNPVLRRARKQFELKRPGFGLIGATERAKQLSGTLTTQHTNDTFVLFAQLPYPTNSGPAKVSTPKMQSS